MPSYAFPAERVFGGRLLALPTLISTDTDNVYRLLVDPGATGLVLKPAVFDQFLARGSFLRHPHPGQVSTVGAAQASETDVYFLDELTIFNRLRRQIAFGWYDVQTIARVLPPDFDAEDLAGILGWLPEFQVFTLDRVQAVVTITWTTNPREFFPR